MNDYAFKTILVGDSNVGKTSLLNKFIYNKFNNTYDVTIGVDLESINLNINDKVIKLQIWDTTGQERFRSIVSSYFRNCAIAFIVFDVENKESFDNACTYWYSKLREKCNKNIRLILVGNKCDSFRRVITEQEVSNRATKLQIDYIEISCKNDINIEKLFYGAAKQILEILPNIPEDDYRSMGVKPTNKEKIKEIISSEDASCCKTM